MTDDEKSLGDDATLGGESPERDIDAQSLGDQPTHGDHSQMDSVGDSSSLGDQLTFGGDESGGALDDGMQITDLDERYTIEGELGKGGMGEVLLATDTRLNRKVAIKRILAKSARSAKAYQRFLNGAQAIAVLNHTNIVQLYDFGRASDGPFMILEYVSGGSLLDRCKQGPIPLEEAIDITCQLCDGLAKAHDAGITHRDIKPANVLMTEDGIPKLTDFDLAKGEVADTGMTMAGAVLGTLDFMPPEQRKDATQVDARSDLWSLAATLYQMVTGESPKVIRLKKVPSQLQDFLDKALEDAKDDRYQSAREFKDALLASRSGTAEVELEEGDCPHCGTKNPTTRNFCRNPDCSESLEVPCLSCSSKIPMWEQVCDSCGTPQPDLLEQRRSQMASAKADAESLLKGFDFDRAKSVAVTLRDEPDPRLMHLKGWAERFLSKIEKGREQQLARFSELMTEAVKHEQAHDYPAGLRTLGQVPEIVCITPLPGHDQSVHDLRKKLQSDVDEIKRLDQLIRTRVKNRNLDGLLAEVEQLQRLQPGRDNLQKLAQQLTARDSKLSATRDEALPEAKKRLANQDYDGCLAQLNRIDASLVDADIEDLKETANIRIDQVNALRDTINLAVQNKQLDGLLPQVDQCLALQAGAEDLLKLRDQLDILSRDEAVVKFRAERERKHKRMVFLKEDLKRRLDSRKFGRVPRLIDELLTLQPSTPSMIQLREQSVERHKEVVRNRIFTSCTLFAGLLGVAAILYFAKDALMESPLFKNAGKPTTTFGTGGEGTGGEGTGGEGTGGEGTGGEGTDGKDTDGEGTDGKGDGGEGTDGKDTDGKDTDGKGDGGEGTGGEGDGGEGDGGKGDGGKGDGGEGTGGEGTGGKDTDGKGPMEGPTAKEIEKQQREKAKQKTTIIPSENRKDPFWELGSTAMPTSQKIAKITPAEGRAKVQSVKLVGDEGAGKPLEEGAEKKHDGSVGKTTWTFRKEKIDVTVMDSGEIFIKKTGQKTIKDEKLELLVYFEDGVPEPQPIRLTPLARMPAVATVGQTLFNAKPVTFSSKPKPESVKFHSDAALFLNSQFAQIQQLTSNLKFADPKLEGEQKLSVRIIGSGPRAHITGTFTIQLVPEKNKVEMRYRPDRLDLYKKLIPQDWKIDKEGPIQFAGYKFEKAFYEQQEKGGKLEAGADRDVNGLYFLLHKYVEREKDVMTRAAMAEEQGSEGYRNKIAAKDEFVEKMRPIKTELKEWPKELNSDAFLQQTVAKLSFLAETDKGDSVVICLGTDKDNAKKQYKKFTMANGR